MGFDAGVSWHAQSYVAGVWVGFGDPAQGAVTIPEGQTSAPITVAIVDDTTDEYDQTFLLTAGASFYWYDENELQVANPVVVGTGTVIDDDDPPTLSIDDVSVTEGELAFATFTVSLSEPSGKEITVAWSTTDDGTATETEDYTQTWGTITCPANIAASQQISVPLYNDLLDEFDETFFVDLSSPLNATIGDGQGVATIVDDETQPIVTIDDITQGESTGTATFTVSLSAPSGRQVSVDYETVGGSAVAPDDYTAGSGTVVIPAGETTATIEVAIVDDAVDGSDKTFDVELLTADSATISTYLHTGTATIVDNEADSFIHVLAPSVTESDETLTFTITLSHETEQDVTVDYTTANGSASSTSDYAAASGTLTFAAGQTSQTLAISISDDFIDELSEEFYLDLSNAQNATIAEPRIWAIIRDDDTTPTAVDDFFLALGHNETLAAAAAGGLLANDDDFDGGSMSVSSWTSPSYGTLNYVNSDGSFEFEPNSALVGDDSFTYVVTDGYNTATATVTISITNDPPLASDDSYLLAEDTTLTVGTTDGVLVNDDDFDDDTLEAYLVSGPSSGALSYLNTDGSFQYVPNSSFTGTDSFDYEVDDGLTTTLATVYLYVDAGSVRAFDDVYDVAHNTALTEAAPGVLSNDFDFEDDTLTVSLVSGPANGTLNYLASDGGFQYTPNTDYSGVDSFVYEATDGSDTEQATVYVIVAVAPGTNNAPFAGDDEYLILHDASLSGDVLANDVDVDEDTLTASLVSGPAYGSFTIALAGDGTFVYQPNSGYVGSDSFTYEISDGTDTATATVSIETYNTPPFATDEFYSTPQETALSGNVLTNDSDDDSDNLTAALVSGPSNGSFSTALAGNGSFVYQPDNDYVGDDSFVYTVSDGIDTVTATVSITMFNDPPDAFDDYFLTQHDTPLTVNPASVLDNDVDANGDNLTVTLIGGPLHGSFTTPLAGDGTFVYQPDAGYIGSDSFVYQLSDGHDTVAATVSIEMTNTAPYAVDDHESTMHDDPLEIALATLLANDGDDDGDSLSLQSYQQPAEGVVTYDAQTETFEYQPDAGEFGPDSFTYVISDGITTSQGTVFVNVQNNLPDTEADVYQVDYDTTLTIDASAGVLANDSDADAESLVAVQVAGPQNGTLDYLNTDGSFEYTPDSWFQGVDFFTYNAFDGAAFSQLTRVFIYVGTVPDMPLVSISDAQAVTEGDPGDTTSNATFTVTLSEVSSEDVVISFAAHALSTHTQGVAAATAGADFHPVVGNRTIAAGSTSTTIAVPIKNDSIDEYDERFRVLIGVTTFNATVVDGEGEGQIDDNDARAKFFMPETLVVSEPAAGSKAVDIKLSIDRKTEKDDSGTFYTTSISVLEESPALAHQGDFDDTYLSMPFPPGIFADDATERTIQVNVNQDDVDEGSERFFAEVHDVSAHLNVQNSQTAITILGIDLRVDSNNDGFFSNADNDETAKPGKFVNKGSYAPILVDLGNTTDLAGYRVAFTPPPSLELYEDAALQTPVKVEYVVGTDNIPSAIYAKGVAVDNRSYGVWASISHPDGVAFARDVVAISVVDVGHIRVVNYTNNHDLVSDPYLDAAGNYHTDKYATGTEWQDTNQDGIAGGCDPKVSFNIARIFQVQRAVALSASTLQLNALGSHCQSVAACRRRKSASSSIRSSQRSVITCARTCNMISAFS